MMIKYFRETKSVDHKTRRAFLEIVSVQVLQEDNYKIEDTLQEFCQEVGGNPYSHDEYEVCVGLQECVEVKDWERMNVLMRKPIFGFIEIEIVKSLKKWLSTRPVAETEVLPATGAPLDEP